MNVEIMIYVYLFVCLAMIVFNIVTAFIFKKRDKKTEHVSERFYSAVLMQLERIKHNGHCDDEHKRYLSRKLKRVGNLIAFDKMLETAYAIETDEVKQYLSELDSVFIALCSHYCHRDSIEAAYIPFIIKKYRLIASRAFPSITETLFRLLDEPSIYCRENAMQALYTTGDCECVIKALMRVDKSEYFYHGKLISDGLLNFEGRCDELIDRIILQFDSFSTEMQINLLNYIRFSSPNYCEFSYSLLSDEDRDDEIRYCAIRYLGKYRFDEAYELLCRLSRELNAEKWQYAAIASTALAIYPSARTVELLKSNLYSRNWYIRYNAAESLERIGVSYSELTDILDGNDRYAAEILRYRLERKERSRAAV